MVLLFSIHKGRVCLMFLAKFAIKHKSEAKLEADKDDVNRDIGWHCIGCFF